MTGYLSLLTAASRRMHRLRLLQIVALVVLTMASACALLADVIAPHDPIAIDLSNTLKPPAFVEGGDSRFLLGTDRLGRDVFSRVIKGTQVSISVALTSIVISSVIGTCIGLYAGYRGGLIETLSMRAVDVALAIPTILLALAFAVIVGPGFWIVIAVIVLIFWAPFARVSRAEAILIKHLEFVDLARVAGASTIRILLRHILPNASDSIVTLATLQVGSIIIIEGILSFLGAGIPPPTPSWGGMVADGRNLLETAGWISLFPGLCLFLVVMSFNLLGDWVRDALDPRLIDL